MSCSAKHPFKQLAARLDKAVMYLRRPALRRLRRKGVGLDCFLKLRAPFLQAAGFRTILDIGANVGQFGLAARAAFPEAQIYSFEPLPDCFAQLQSNLADESRWQALNCGLGRTSGELSFERNESPASSSFLKMAESHKREFPGTGRASRTVVKVERLDDVAARLIIEPPLLIKIDVQGYEGEVLAGGPDTLRKAGLVIVEMSLETLYEGQPLFDDVHRRMGELGFRFAGSFDEIVSPSDGRVLQMDGMYVPATASTE